MQCISMDNVRFSPSSMDAIKDIRRKQELSKLLAAVLPAGVMVNIFAGNNTLKSSFNISQTDFVALTQAMKALPAIQKKVIRNIALRQAFSTTGKEAQFWRAVVDGCGIQ